MPHHLIDLCDPSQAYSAARFVADARRLIGQINARGRIALLAGGTMLYFKALIDGIDAMPAADAAVRTALDERAAALGWPALHAELAAVDPVTAARLKPHDAQRIQRALEVWQLSGQPISAFHGRQAQPGSLPGLALPLFALEPADRSWLHQRIAQRFEAMLDKGLIDEVRRLRARGDLHADLPSMRCVGYRQAWAVLDANEQRPDLALLRDNRHCRHAPAGQAPADLAARHGAYGAELRCRRCRRACRACPGPDHGCGPAATAGGTMSGEPPVLRIDGLAKTYAVDGAATPVFRNVSLTLAPGEFVALLGESGVGKSTLLNCIAGLDQADDGRIAINGLELQGLDEPGRARLRRESLGFVFQAFHVLPQLDVAQNVGLPLKLLGRHGPEAEARVQQVLQAVGLQALARRAPAQLSGGQLQRVALARALVHRPRLLLADEPTGNLDPATAERMIELLRAQVHEQGCACLLVTHSAAAAARADRRLWLRPDGVSDDQPASTAADEAGEADGADTSQCASSAGGSGRENR